MRIPEGIKRWARERHDNVKQNWFMMFLAAVIGIWVALQIAYLSIHS